MKRPCIRLILPSVVALTLISCGGENTGTTETTAVDSTMIVEDKPEVWGFDATGGNSYQVPSPNELFAIIKESKLGYQEDLISMAPVNYTSSKIQALNFGRLTADIAYTASYEKFQESITNFDNLRKVGDDLGISYVFDEIMVGRVKSNMDNADSLEVISSSSYQRIISQLEEGEKGSTLAIIAAGGFIESIYILTSMVETYGEASPMIQRIADQKLVMENVLDYLNIFNEEPRIQEVQQELQSITDIYSMLAEESISEQKSEKSEKGARTILGGNRIIMTSDEFNDLKAATLEYRNSFTNPNSGQ
jgi:hypothetical protein